MSISHLVYPDKNGLTRLLNELTEFFVQFPCVNRIFTFGSLARGDWDRWSDIDLLVVTQASSGQQWRLFNNLRGYKPVLHHHALISLEPSGGFIPGIVFENESVFHILDLNFISLTEYQSPQALERFGKIHEIFISDRKYVEIEGRPLHKPTAENPDERQIGRGIHWTKKAVKKFLRGSDNVDELKAASTRLKEIMLDYSEDTPMPGGNICHLARQYIQISDFLLVDKQPHPNKHDLYRRI